MRFTTFLLAGVMFTVSQAQAQETEVTASCTAVEIVQVDGIKRLSSVPKLEFLENLGTINFGSYTGNIVTITLQGSGQILCQLHEQHTSDSE